MNTTQWPQEIGVFKTMEGSRPILEKKARPEKDQALNCPRCNSTNTKFCYYNNYSLKQPRYLCKTCRRYWTAGGSLRNVPVGGGSRKNKRSSTLSSSKKLFDLNPHGFPQSASQNPKIHERQDLNLAYPPSAAEDYSNIHKFVEAAAPYSTETRTHHHNNPSASSSISFHHHMSAMEILRTGITPRGSNSFLQIPASESNTIFSTGFPLQEFIKPNLNFSSEGFEGGYMDIQGEPAEAGERVLFPMEDLKQGQINIECEQNRGQGDHPTGYWHGFLGGGSW